MTSERKLAREVIIQTLVDTLKPLDYVHAFWEGGAAAHNRVDEWSDLDLYLVVDDKKVDDTFLALEKGLKLVSPIKQKHGVFKHTGFYSQAFYSLQDASEYLMIDVAVFELSSPDKELEPEIHGNAVFYFNKSNKIKPPRLDKDAFVKQLQKRLVGLEGEFYMFNNFVQKEINRGNSLEAIDSYYLLLKWLVETLRISYSPLHYDFKMRYIHYELPADIVKQLERLYFVKDMEDLQKKYDEVVEWFPKMMSEIDNKKIERQIRMP